MADRFRSMADQFRSVPNKQRRHRQHGEIKPKKRHKDKEEDKIHAKWLIGGAVFLFGVVATIVGIVASHRSSDSEESTEITGGGERPTSGGGYPEYITTPSPYNDTYWSNVRGDCGEPAIKPELVSGRIVGGTYAKPHSWPWQVSIVDYKKIGTRDRIRHFCGGTLVGPDIVITAVHCFLNNHHTAVTTKTFKFRVIVGGQDKSKVTDGAKLVEISKIFHHPKNNLATFAILKSVPKNDLTILRLKEKFDPSKKYPAVSFACLPKPKVIPPAGKRCWTSGWGKTRNTGYSNVLKQTPQGSLSQRKCNAYYGGRISYAVHFCAKEKNMGTCQGDSGGPLVCQGSDNRWTLYGATSFGPSSCFISPTVYTSVSHFLEWICCTVKDVGPCSEIKCKT